MRFRNTLVLAALFLAFAGYLYFVEQPSHEQAEAAKKLLTFKAEDVSKVTLAYPDREIVLKKTGAGWQIQKPMEVPADQTAVDNLVRAASDAEVKRTIESPQGLETYGLDKPEATVTLELADGKSLPAIHIGKTAPVGFSAFAQLEGSNDVKLVPSIFQTGMKREVKDLRDKAVIDFKEDEVQSIKLAGADSMIELARDGAGWKMTSPKALKADPNEVRTLMSSIRGIRAEDFVDDPGSLADYGLDHPRKTITIGLGKDSSKEILVGAEKAKDSKNVLYVKRADGKTVYAVGTWSWGSLDKDATTLRDKTVLPFELASLASVEVVRRDGETYKLIKEKSAAAQPATPAAEAALPEATWKLDGATNSKSVAISTLVGDIHGLKGYEIAAEKPKDLAPYHLAEPELTFSLLDHDGKPIGRVIAGQVEAKAGETDANSYAMVEGGDVVFKIRGYLYAHLDKKKQDFVETSAPAAAKPSIDAPATSGEAADDDDGD